MSRTQNFWIGLERLTLVAVLAAATTVVWTSIVGQADGANTQTTAPSTQVPTPTAPPVDLVLSAGLIDAEAAKGNPATKIAIIEFTDYQCDFCRAFATNVYPTVERELIAPGHARYLIMNLPLDSHQHARDAALVVECSGRQGKLWEMRERLFGNKEPLDMSRLKAFAVQVGVRIDGLELCMSDGRIKKRIDKQLIEARRLGINATPTFLVGEVNDDGTIRIRQRIIGGHGIEVFRAAVESVAQSS